MNEYTHKAWQQYEAGKEYKRRIGLYETCRRNEAFYRGEQWANGEGKDLPRPVFNIVKRVADYLICSVASADLSIRFTDEELPFADEYAQKQINTTLSALTENAAYRWEQSNMDTKVFSLLTDAAISGDGAVYCYWNTELKSPQDYAGDIVTEIIDSINIFPADVNKPDIQSQEYVILSGRASVASLREEAHLSGVSDDDLKKIIADNDACYQSGKQAEYELEGDDEAKTTFIIKFWKEKGKVCFEKSVKSCVIRRAKTDCSLYPIAFFNWTPTKNSFHGTSAVGAMIPNQKFINRAYAMAMKHMTDTAFSKVIYDKSKIPEWSNEVGEAIAAMGGGNISDAVSVVGTGEMQSGFMDLIEKSVTLTKELMGATESALGNMEAKNTSAILALQETSRISLDNVRRAYYGCIEELANIWADMTAAYYPSDRLLPCTNGKETVAKYVDTQLIRKAAICARVDIAEVTRYSAAAAQNMLDKLLDGGYITPSEYVRRLPAGLLMDRNALIMVLEKRENNLTTEDTYE
ncbi:MAG: hypothetical protein E7653_06960 [Ruminococcaceae bacterium]|nr:hypothetical protein [Oscillospiraceae bacterium]